VKRLAVVIFLALAAGCGIALMDVVKDKDEGTAQRYQVTGDLAWDIAKTVFRWAGADRITEHRAERYLTASDTDDTQRDVGTVMVAWIEPDPDGVIRVTVRTRTRMPLNPEPLLTEAAFHRRFSQAAALVKEGKPLPPQPPE
jgi:hypothetical protein